MSDSPPSAWYEPKRDPRHFEECPLSDEEANEDEVCICAELDQAIRDEKAWDSLKP